MQNRVLVAYESRHGSTREIADRIAATLRTQDVDATAMPVEAIRDADGYDGYVIGSAVYAMHWLGPMKTFVHRNRTLLRRHPVWLFSSGPLSNAADALAEAAPREVAAIERDLEARGHTMFAGSWQRDARPIGFLETMMRAFPAAREALPDADYRDWPAVDAFSTNVAGELELALRPD